MEDSVSRFKYSSIRSVCNPMGRKRWYPLPIAPMTPIPASVIFDTKSSKGNKYPEEEEDAEEDVEGREGALSFEGAKKFHWNQHRTKSTPFFFRNSARSSAGCPPFRLSKIPSEIGGADDSPSSSL